MNTSYIFHTSPSFQSRSQSESTTNLKLGVLVLLVWGKMPRVDLSLCVWLLGQRGKCIEKDVLVSVWYLYQLFLFRFVCTTSTSRSCQSHSDHRRALCTFAPDFILIIIIILTWIMHHCVFIVCLQHWCADWICAQMNRVVKMRRMCILALAEYELLYQHNKDTRYCRFTA